MFLQVSVILFMGRGSGLVGGVPSPQGVPGSGGGVPGGPHRRLIEILKMLTF